MLTAPAENNAAQHDAADQVEDKPDDGLAAQKLVIHLDLGVVDHEALVELAVWVIRWTFV